MALAAVLVVGTMLLAIPVRLVVHVGRTDRMQGGWRIRWLFGLVDVRSGMRKPGRQKPARSETPRHVGRARAPKPLRSARRRAIMLPTLRTRGLVWRVVRLLADLGRQVRCERFYLHATFGLNDPADTGRVYGALAPLLSARVGRGSTIRCQPCFLRECLEVSCAATFRLRPLSLVAPFTVFLCSRPVLTAARVSALHAWRTRR